jgi:hypothetical protein
MFTDNSIISSYQVDSFDASTKSQYPSNLLTFRPSDLLTIFPDLSLIIVDLLPILPLLLNHLSILQPAKCVDAG